MLDNILTAAYPVLPVWVSDNPAHALPLAETLVARGVRVLEITLPTDTALPVIHTIATHVPRAIVVPVRCAHARNCAVSQILAPNSQSASAPLNVCSLLPVSRQ
jgi:hypothetical protein